MDVAAVEMPPLEILFGRFGLALVLGFLIGLERERDKELVFAGMRTFALISLLGAMLAFGAQQFAGPWLFIIGFVAVSAFALLSHSQGLETGHIGITTEVVFMLAFLVGALVYWDLLALAAAVTVVTVLLLTFKPNLQALLARVSREDILAGLEFAVVWVVVLPILPNRTYGPLDVLNPREIWLMVVLVAGLNLLGYALSQIYGMQRAVGMTGILGGLISSTAVTYQLSRRSRKENERQFSGVFALAIAIASTGMFVRVLLLALILNPVMGLRLIVPMAAGAVVTLVGVLALWRQTRQQGEPPPEDGDAPPRRSPFALRPAVQFGLMFAAVLWLAKAAQVYLPDTGVYLTGVVGGLAGLDAVVLSMARLSGRHTPELIAVQAVALGAAANMLFKGGIAVWQGAGQVRNRIAPLFGLAAVVSIVAAFVAV